VVQLMTTRYRGNARLRLDLCVSRAAAEPSNLGLELLFGGEGSIVWLLHCLSNERLELGSVHGLSVQLE
jgi:hypothetical protein